jgi:hypothetical protein
MILNIGRAAAARHYTVRVRAVNVSEKTVYKVAREGLFSHEYVENENEVTLSESQVHTEVQLG